MRCEEYWRNFAVRKLNMNEEEIKEKLDEFSTFEEIPTVKLIRMIYSLSNEEYNSISDKKLWNFAIENGIIDLTWGIGMQDTITMQDMYVIVVRGLKNVANNF